MTNKRRYVNIVLVIAAITLLIVLPRIVGQNSSRQTLTFVQFQQNVANHQVQSPVVLRTKDLRLQGTLTDGKAFSVGYTQDFPVSTYLTQNKIDFTTDPQNGFSWGSLLGIMIPLVLVGFMFVLLLTSMRSAGGRTLSVAQSKVRRVRMDQPRVTFEDVAGVNEAVEELQEIKEFLANPIRFRQLGAKIPKGVLLYGPPGTGKTLLARAVAGEAGVPFFSISGSEFVELFVGVGASRVRDLFAQAKENQPSIVFIDEIDAVGRRRGAGTGGGNDEREQTLNQLLVEMDGFEQNDAVIVMAGTNRTDVLDPALLRPGRFDRHVLVDPPDKAGRRRSWRFIPVGQPLAPDLALDKIAAQTPGFTGADLANLVNEAALLTARRGKKLIGREEFDEAAMRLIAGPEKKSRILTERERLITAYHESGHALVAHYLPGADPVQKVSIVRRGQALGYTITLPTEDRFMVEKREILHRMAHMLGGRAAEEIRFDDITTGASNDLQKATETARRMITQYGMSENLGPLTLGRDPSIPMSPWEGGPEYSERTAQKIDMEIHRVINQAHETATSVLMEHRPELDMLASILVERETIEKEEFEALLRGESPAKVFPKPRTPEVKRGEPAPEATLSPLGG